MSRHLRAAIAATIALLALAATVSAHDITGVDVSCGEQLIVVHGVNFPATTVQVSGPSGYGAHFDVQGSWTHQLALGPDGAYAITWPGAGSHATSFVVECEQATPTPKVTPTPTPTPERTLTPPHTHRPNVTPPPTDADAATAINESGVLIAVMFVVVAAALGFAAAGRRR